MEIHIEHKKIRNRFYFGTLFTILVLSILFALLYTSSINREFSKLLSQLSESIVESKKRFMKNAVDRTIADIDNQRGYIDSCKIYAAYSQNARDSIVQEIVSNRIRAIRLINNGYLWINQIENFSGGDNYAIRRVHPNLPETEGEWLSTKFTDIKGNRPYEEELRGINDSGHLYFEYYFKKMDSDIVSHKISYAKLYKPYNWVIATGVYLDDVDSLIVRETAKLARTRNRQYLFSGILGSIAILICVIVIVIIEKQINKMIRDFDSASEQYTNELIAEKERTQKALDEIVTLQGMLPICANCKKIRDDNGYWEQVDSYMRKRTKLTFSHGLCPDCIKELYGDEFLDEDES